jgi:membrane protease YdiL (CAAX protease family)
MNRKQIIVLAAPPVLVLFMYPIFQFLSGKLGETIGWYLGLASYWLIWGALFPLAVIGVDGIIAMIRPQKLTVKILLLVLFPVLMASLYRFIPGMGYDKSNFWMFLLFISTAFGNGFFEEVLWRGVYRRLVPDSILFSIIWPSIWFALWHFVPGSVHSDGNVVALMIGAGIFGFYLSFLAKQTGTVWWSILSHVLGGLVMVL